MTNDMTMAQSPKELNKDIIAAARTGKSIEEIRYHYRLLVDDVNGIKSGIVPLPGYAGSPAQLGNRKDEATHTESGIARQYEQTQPGTSDENASGTKIKRRKGQAWTEEEHRLFLSGLQEFGKGDWKRIASNYVRSKTSIQVASHGQKFFCRLNSRDNKFRRKSIHDISLNGGDVVGKGPVLGQNEQAPRQPFRALQQNRASISDASDINVNSRVSKANPLLGVWEQNPSFSMGERGISVQENPPLRWQTTSVIQEPCPPVTLPFSVPTLCSFHSPLHGFTLPDMAAVLALDGVCSTPPYIGGPVKEPYTPLSVPYPIATLCNFNTPPRGFTPPRHLDDLGSTDAADSSSL